MPPVYSYCLFHSGFFVKELYKKGATPNNLLKNYLDVLLWLGKDDGYPTVNGKRTPWMVENHDSIPKFMMFILTWALMVMLQLVCLLILILFRIFTGLCYLTLFFLGYVFYQTKLLSLNHVWNYWLFCWTGEQLRETNSQLPTKITSHKSALKDSNVTLDAGMFNRSLFEEFIFETFPQIIMQVINNYYTTYTTITVFSLVFSAIIMADGIWRMVYWRYFKQVAFDDIPVKLPGGIINLNRVITTSETSNVLNVLHDIRSLKLENNNNTTEKEYKKSNTEERIDADKSRICDLEKSATGLMMQLSCQQSQMCKFVV